MTDAPSVLRLGNGAVIVKLTIRMFLEKSGCIVQNGLFVSVTLDIVSPSTHCRPSKVGREPLLVPSGQLDPAQFAHHVLPCPSIIPPPSIIIFVAFLQYRQLSPGSDEFVTFRQIPALINDACPNPIVPENRE